MTAQQIFADLSSYLQLLPTNGKPIVTITGGSVYNTDTVEGGGCIVTFFTGEVFGSGNPDVLTADLSIYDVNYGILPLTPNPTFSNVIHGTMTLNADPAVTEDQTGNSVVIDTKTPGPVHTAMLTTIVSPLTPWGSNTPGLLTGTGFGGSVVTFSFVKSVQLPKPH